MRPFVIEIYWPDVTSELVADLVNRTAAAVAPREDSIRLLGCEMVPRDETCFLRVTAADSHAVEELVETLGLQGARVSELVDVPSPAAGGAT